MNLLLDTNLSWRLIQRLSPVFENIDHVDQIGLTVPAADIEIWKWAKEKNAIIITNDEDFQYFLVQKGFPPKIVLLRTGN
ncbi:MAG: DUF5615 family PIN-like protein [Bacteroidota bacterium]